VEANHEVFLHRQELARVTMEHEKLRAEHEVMVELARSKTYRLAEAMVSVRRRITRS
jgi:hypothetical protein